MATPAAPSHRRSSPPDTSGVADRNSQAVRVADQVWAGREPQAASLPAAEE